MSISVTAMQFGWWWGAGGQITKCYHLNLVKDDLMLMRLTYVLSIFAFSSTGRRNLKERDITTSCS